MTGLEKIIEKIGSDSSSRCASIIKAAEIKADKIIESSKLDAEKEAKQIIEAAEERCAKAEEISKSRREQAQKQAILKAKVDAINDVIAFASKRLSSMPDKEYFDILVKLAVKYSVEGTGEIMLNAYDKKRMPSDFISRIQDSCKNNSATITLSDTDANIPNGFLLKYGFIEINCSFDALISEQREDLKEKVNSILFQGA